MDLEDCFLVSVLECYIVISNVFLHDCMYLYCFMLCYYYNIVSEISLLSEINR